MNLKRASSFGMENRRLIFEIEAQEDSFLDHHGPVYTRRRSPCYRPHQKLLVQRLCYTSEYERNSSMCEISRDADRPEIVRIVEGRLLPQTEKIYHQSKHQFRMPLLSFKLLSEMVRKMPKIYDQFLQSPEILL